MIPGFKDTISARKRRIKIASYIGATLVGMYFLAPILYASITSIQVEQALLVKPPRLIPRLEDLTFDNYYFTLTGKLPPAFQGFAAAQMVAGLQIFPTLVNSFIVAICVTIITTGLATLAAYSFARIKFPGDMKLFVTLMATRLLPYITIAIPVYMIIKNMGLLDTLVALILVYSAVQLPWRVWLLTIYFQSAVPELIEDAARIDGAGRLKTIFRIVLPLAMPGLIAVSIFSFMEAFGEFIFALILTSTVRSQTLPVTIAMLSQAGLWYSRSLIMAVSITASLPPVILALVFRRYVLEGLTRQFGVRRE